MIRNREHERICRVLSVSCDDLLATAPSCALAGHAARVYVRSGAMLKPQVVGIPTERSRGHLVRHDHNYTHTNLWFAMPAKATTSLQMRACVSVKLPASAAAGRSRERRRVLDARTVRPAAPHPPRRGRTPADHRGHGADRLRRHRRDGRPGRLRVPAARRSPHVLGSGRGARADARHLHARRSRADVRRIGRADRRRSAPGRRRDTTRWARGADSEFNVDHIGPPLGS